jgi:hypothetical protein
VNYGVPFQTMFQKLFRAADALAGNDVAPDFDTSRSVGIYGKDRDGSKAGKRKPNFVVQESDEILLRKCVKLVKEDKLPPVSERISYRLIDDEADVLTDSTIIDLKPTPVCGGRPVMPYEVPEYAWDAIVSRMIHAGELEAREAAAAATALSITSPRPKTSRLPVESAAEKTASRQPANVFDQAVTLPSQPFRFRVDPIKYLDHDRISAEEARRIAHGLDYDELDTLFPNPCLYIADPTETTTMDIVVPDIVPQSTRDRFGVCKDDIPVSAAKKSAVTPTAASSSAATTPTPVAAPAPAPAPTPSAGAAADATADAKQAADGSESNGPLVPESKAEREKKMLEDKAKRLASITVGGHDAAASILQRQMGQRRPRDDIPHLRNKFKAAVSILNHNDIATKNANTKMDLTDAELRCFHRPRLAKANKAKPWSIDSIGYRDKKGNKLDKAPMDNDIFSSKPLAYTDAEKQDLSLHYGDFILMEYVEENPPILLNPGMASAMINYCRINNQQEAEEDARQQKMRSEALQAKGILGGAGNHSHRIPKHLQMLLSQRGAASTELTTNAPKLPLGETKMLGAEDPSPFLGDVGLNEIVPSFTNNLFRAPIFIHNASQSEFLMIKIKNKSKTSLSFTVREIPKIFLCGQMEPQKVVFRPSKVITRIQESMMLLAAARLFRGDNAQRGLDFRHVQENLLRFYRCKTAFHAAALKKTLRDRVAVEESTAHGHKKWYPKIWDEQVEHDEYEDEDAAEKMMDDKRKYSLEELERSFPPEDACLQESCNACDRKYLDLGICQDVELQTVRAWLERMKRLKQYRIDRVASLKLVADNLLKFKGSGNTQWQACHRVVTQWIKEIKELEEKVKIGQFIYDRLLVAPWNTTEAFVNCHILKDGSGKLELVGQGDPSGIGEGFALVRSARQASLVKKKNEPLVNTDKDLRKLSRPEMTQLLKNFGIPEDTIKSLKRWDMVHVIREYSTKADLEGMTEGAILKFSRTGNKIANSELEASMETQKELAQQIWNRQKAALSVALAPRTREGRGSHSGSMSPSSLDDYEDELSGEGDGEGGRWSKEEEGWEDFLDDDNLDSVIEKRMKELQSEDRRNSAAKEAAQLREEQKELSGIKGLLSGSTDEQPKMKLSKGQLKRQAAKQAKLEAANREANKDSAAAAPKADVVGEAFGASTSADEVLEDMSSPVPVDRPVPQPAASAPAPPTISIAASSSASSSVAAPAPAPVEPTIRQFPAGRRPTKAVKRTVRTIHEDGTETIEVQFLIAANDVFRVEADKAHEHSRAMYYDDAEIAFNIEHEEEVEEINRPRKADPGLVLRVKNFNAVCLVVNMLLYLSKFVRILFVTVFRVQAAEMQMTVVDQRTRQNTIVVDEVEYKPIKSTTRTAGVQINQRLPHVQFSAKLEKLLMEEYKKHYSFVFRTPVPQTIPGYYDLISTPMCLSDMRDKLITFQYTSRDEFLADVELILKNSEKFNGIKSPITNNAKQLYDSCKLNLYHDLQFFGPEKDEFTLLENAIKKK